MTPSIKTDVQRYTQVQLTLVPMLRVGMHWVTLRVTKLQPGAVSKRKGVAGFSAAYILGRVE